MNSDAQTVVQDYNALKLSRVIDSLRENFGINKEIPNKYELQALAALSHYPQLKDVKVKFKERKGGSPFVSRPTVWSTFFRRKHKRTYLVFIRTDPHLFMDPILIHNMPFNAQIGVLGHELAHTVDFINRNVFGMINVIFGNLSTKYMDHFEFETDRRAVHHGLGYQLLAWSEHTAKSFGLVDPAELGLNDKTDGIIIRERYMRPSTIKKEMSSLDIYPEYDGLSKRQQTKGSN